MLLFVLFSCDDGKLEPKMAQFVPIMKASEIPGAAKFWLASRDFKGRNSKSLVYVYDVINCDFIFRSIVMLNKVVSPDQEAK